MARFVPSRSLLVAFFCSVAVTALAAPIDDATAAYEGGDFVTALRLLRPLAQAGDPLAQVDLGRMYDRGVGVAPDDAESAVWFRKAALQGYAIGQFNLGLAYHKGRGVALDYVQAARWTELAAVQGYAVRICGP